MIQHYFVLDCQVTLRGKDPKDVQTVGTGDQGGQLLKTMTAGGYRVKNPLTDLKNGEVL